MSRLDQTLLSVTIDWWAMLGMPAGLNYDRLLPQGLRGGGRGVGGGLLRVAMLVSFCCAILQRCKRVVCLV